MISRTWTPVQNVGEHHRSVALAPADKASTDTGLGLGYQVFEPKHLRKVYIVDITQMILDDHHEQRRLFAIIEQIDTTDTVALGAVWKRLATFLEVHAETEEKIFYPQLLRVGRKAGDKDGVEKETIDAIKDHNEIRDAVAAVAKTKVGTTAWIKAIAAANKANSEHMGEEEREGLTDFRRQASLQLRHDLAVAFATYEVVHVTGVEPVDKDPKTFVKEHG